MHTRPFKYTEKGAVGLLKDKKEMHIQAAGGLYHGEGIKPTLPDLGSIYLDNTMKFYGIDNINSVYIEGVDADPTKRDDIVNAAMNEAEKKAKGF